MSETRILPLLTWRSAICESDLSSVTRHVALTLSVYMNERGGSAFPGAIRLAKDTGLSERAIRTHLGLLVKLGWLVKKLGGGRGLANEYTAMIALNPAPDAGMTEETLHLTTLNPAPDDTKPCTPCTPSLKELSKNSGRARKRATSPSPNFVPTAAHETYATDHGLDLSSEVLRWLTDCEAKGRTYSVVNAGFSTWLHRAVDFGRGGKPIATLEQLAEPVVRVPRTCPLELCGGSGFVDIPGERTAQRCACRRSAGVTPFREVGNQK